jgi:hypothetical protein
LAPSGPEIECSRAVEPLTKERTGERAENGFLRLQNPCFALPGESEPPK